MTSGGTVATFVGSTTGVSGYINDVWTAARFLHPNFVAVGADSSLYVADEGNCVIRMITPSEAVETHPGTPNKQGLLTSYTRNLSIPTLSKLDGINMDLVFLKIRVQRLLAIQMENSMWLLTRRSGKYRIRM